MVEIHSPYPPHRSSCTPPWDLLAFPRVPVRTDDRVLGRPLFNFFPESSQLQVEILDHVPRSLPETLFAVCTEPLALVYEGGGAFDMTRPGRAEKDPAAADVK